jgi:dihydroflavonol-4-reductase
MILVTGGTGFLGAHLLMELCTQGKKVKALKRPSSDLEFVKIIFSYYNKSNLFENIEWVDADILDIQSLLPAMQGVEHVYHCAATVSFSGKKSKKLLENNISGTSNIVDAALEAGVKKYVMSVLLRFWEKMRSSVTKFYGIPMKNIQRTPKASIRQSRK